MKVLVPELAIFDISHKLGPGSKTKILLISAFPPRFESISDKLGI